MAFRPKVLPHSEAVLACLVRLSGMVSRMRGGRLGTLESAGINPLAAGSMGYEHLLSSGR
jgi:hypothetical protein